MMRPPGKIELAGFRSAGRIPAGAAKLCAASVLLKVSSARTWRQETGTSPS
jgi:hypothetical protein